MVISCLGDSLTQGDYGVYGKSGIANVHEKNYPYFLAENTGADVRNFGVCGLDPTSYLKYYQEGNVDVKGSDIIIIMLGSNGGLDPEKSTQGNTDYEKIINLCKRDEPNADIFVCTPPHATENPEFSNFGYAERVKKAALFIRDFSEKNDLNLIDVANSNLFTAENEHIMQANDGLHFVEEGYRTLAAFFEKELRRYGKIG